jgi:hypothetical protein
MDKGRQSGLYFPCIRDQDHGAKRRCLKSTLLQSDLQASQFCPFTKTVQQLSTFSAVATLGSSGESSNCSVSAWRTNDQGT